MPDDSELVEVYRARGLPEAHALRLHLEQSGVGVHIDNELLQGAVGELPMGWATAPRIMVRRADEPSARALVEEFIAERPARRGTSLHCLACGATMGEADTCPACDWTYAADSPTEDEPVAEPPPDQPGTGGV